MNFSSRVSPSCSDPKAAGPADPDPNHNSLFDLLDQHQPLHGPDALSLFDDLDLDKASNPTDFLVDDLADLIEEKSTIPMLVVSGNFSTTTMMSPVLVVNETERRRNEATALLKSLSVPDPLLGQLVAESLTGFIFVVDAQGRVEFVSASSTEQVGHSPEHIRGNPIYNFLHPADHSRFGCHLVQQQSPPTSNTDPDKARRNFTCRFKLLNSTESYITLYIACITVRRNQDSVETSRLLCVARKLSDVSPLSMVTTTTVPSSNVTDLFATRLDPGTFKVMLADNSPSATSNSRLKASVAAKTVSMVGKCFLDFCHPDDRDVVRGHFLSTVRDKVSVVSSVYRMTGLIGNNNGSNWLNNVVHVQTKSKYHKNNNIGFIASIHSIVGEVPNANHRAPVVTTTTTSAFAPAAVVMMPSKTSSTLSSLLEKSSPSPTSENSDEAKNQLLKQLLNPNYQPNDDNDRSILKMMDNKDRSGLKRSAGSPLDNGPATKTVSVVCSENPSLTELLEKPPHITVPPPVPTKWHQEPREKLPKDIMRKFLPPHPAERAAAAVAAAASATATSTSSALYSVLTRTSYAPLYSSNAGNSRTVTTASTSSNIFEAAEDKDEILSEILDGLIEFQEKSPSSSTIATRADERRISDIERFLVSSERSLLQPLQKASPLTSILSAPPLATPSGRPPPVNGSRPPPNPVNLVPRMNELLQQVPPNVSIPDTPDLDSLMLLQERRRRMSSGGSVIVSTSGQPTFHVQAPMTSPQMGRGQLLMQQLTNSSPRSSSSNNSYMEQPSNGGPPIYGNYTNNPAQQPLVRRSSFSGLSGGANNNATSVSPPSGAVAAAAAAVAAASSGQRAATAQRHSSGGTVHHGGPSRAGQHPMALGRRLSDSVESTNNSDDKQRSLLQQLLSE